jgi:hypothetical protein
MPYLMKSVAMKMKSVAMKWKRLITIPGPGIAGMRFAVEPLA